METEPSAVCVYRATKDLCVKQVCVFTGLRRTAVSNRCVRVCVYRATKDGCVKQVCVCVCVYRATKDGCVRQMLMTAFSIYFDLLC